ncbi:MAG TPA: TonB-dependent receptor [Steroidobacteraceae bacterium]|nr:TonB-dependent receptor [Steroidobacteraceae bacterium]
MVTKEKSADVRHAVRRALLLSAVAVAAVGQTTIVSAQDTETAAPIDEVIVTGSRLMRSRDLVAASPVQTIDVGKLADSGSVTIEETLNEFPQLNPDNTGTVNQSGGTGVASADLRGLGAVRTLVLVNGRRFIPADVTGLVDLGTIPDGLVDRVEIITGGASAVYGSDAIAGAVNFILKRDFEGAQVHYQYGETDRGDGASHKADILLGVNTEDGRGNATVYAAYTERDPVYMADRKFSRQPLLENAQGQLVNFGSGNIPGGLIGISAANLSRIQGVDLTNANGACPGAIQGVRFGENGQPFPFCRPTEQYNYAAVNFLQRPLESWQITTTGHYDLADRVQVYGEFFYTKKQNQFQQAPEAVSPTSSGRPTGTVAITNADTNPLFPQPLRDFFAANRDFFDADGDGIFLVNSTSRRFEEFGPRNTSITADSFNLTTGLRGDFDLGERSWHWDTFFQFARSDVELIQTGLLSRSRTTLGLDTVVDANGNVTCRVNLLGCVPVNIFGIDTLTPQMANFLSVQTGRTDDFTRKSAGASIAGDLFNIWAGPVSSAFGVEWREERYHSNPAEIAASGDLTSTPIAPQYTTGKFDVKEAFAEFRVPLLNDLPAIKSLAVEAAVRQSDYSTIDSVLTWKGTLDWEVVNWLRVRGGVSRAIRAPNLDELYAQPSSGFTGGVDPCWVTSNPSQAQRDLCVAQGVPASEIGTFLPSASQGWNSLSGGNPNLKEEESDAKTLGIVFTPSWAGNLAVSLDYFDIEVEGAVAQVSSQALVNSCFATLDPSGAACGAITRLPSGQIDQVSAPVLNVASRKVSGVDLAISYTLDLPQWLSLPGESGTLGLQWVSTWQDEDVSRTLPNLPVIDCAGRYSGTCSGDGVRITPDFRGLFRTMWNTGPLSLIAELSIIGDLKLAQNAIPNQNGTISEWYYLDLSGKYQLTDKVKLVAGVNNALDKAPPVIGFTGGGDSNTNIPLFDPLGRRYYAGVTFTF